MVEYLEPDHGLMLEHRGLAETTDVYYATGFYPELDEDHLVVNRERDDEHRRPAQLDDAVDARGTVGPDHVVLVDLDPRVGVDGA